MNTVFPSRISFAGIDERTDIGELIALTEYGKERGIVVEFGVLLSSRNGEEGNNRYPSLDYMKDLSGKKLNLSLHLCGKYTSKVMKTGTLEDVKELLGEELYSSFQRIQINVVGRKTKAPDLFPEGKEIIVQTNLAEKYSSERFEYYKDGKHGNVVFLSDASGGKGESGNYQCYGTEWQGYAGGITPENVLDVIKIVNAISRSGEYYLDLESGCREDDWFSINKCRAIIDKISAKA